MNSIHTLLARFGIIARKPSGPDAFDLRLQRIGTRESRLKAHANLFKSLLQPLEVAARS